MALQACLVYHYDEVDEKQRTRFSIVEEACRLLSIEKPSAREALELDSGEMAIEDFFALRIKIFFNFTTKLLSVDSEWIEHKFIMIPAATGPMYKRRP